MARPPMPPPQDFPPLLPEGLHSQTIDNVQTLCLDGFPESTSRPGLMRGLRDLGALITEVGIRADLWICGSFVTEKLNPKDVDVVLDIGSQIRFSEGQERFIRWFTAKNSIQVSHMLEKFGCDCYITETNSREDRLAMFGSDRQGSPRGIIVIAINGGAP